MNIQSFVESSCDTLLEAGIISTLEQVVAAETSIEEIKGNACSLIAALCRSGKIYYYVAIFPHYNLGKQLHYMLWYYNMGVTLLILYHWYHLKIHEVFIGYYYYYNWNGTGNENG